MKKKLSTRLSFRASSVSRSGSVSRSSSSSSIRNRNRGRVAQRRFDRTALLCLLYTWFFFSTTTIHTIHAQNVDNCRLEMWVYSSESQCEAGESPSARGYLYADETCRTTDIFDKTSNAYDDSFPGTYEARCLENGRVEIYQSGCISPDCAPATSSGTCERDFSVPSGFYSLVNPPRYPVAEPGSRACGFLTNAEQELLVVFTIYGDCTACLASLEEPQPPPLPPPTPEPTRRPTNEPTEAPTNPFTPPPTFLRQTRAPTVSPTVPPEPTAEPTAEPTVEPTAEETAEPPPEPTPPTLAPFLPPFGRFPTAAPSSSPSSSPPAPTETPSTIVVVPPSPAPSQSAQPSTLTAAPTTTVQPTVIPTTSTTPPPTQPTQPSPIVNGDGSSSSSNSGAIIGGAVGGGVAILVPLLLCAVWYGQKRERTKQSDQSSSENVVVGASTGGGDDGENRNRRTPQTALTDSAASPPAHALFMSPNNVENAEILVPSDREDDVSTLGTPLVGLGYIDEDEQTASVDYDYRSRGRSSVAEESRTGSVTLTSLGKSTLEAFETRGLSLFDHDDERSFDEAFDEGGNGFAGGAGGMDDKDAIEGFDCQVPEGKLGIVLDSPNPGYAPVVHALRPDSILNGHVRVGDRIVAVDGVDVAHLNHIEVSALISRKSGMPRKLTFVRRKGKNGSTNNSEC